MIGIAPARLVADCGGCIDAIAMTIPLRLLETAPMKGAALGKLIEALPPQLTLFLMTDDPTATIFADWHQSLDCACDITLISVGADAPVLESEIWSQDPWMVAEQGSQLRLHYLRHTDRPGRHALWLSSYCQLAQDEPLLQLAGGNTLTGPDFRILGTQSVELTRRVGQGPVSFDEALSKHRSLDPRPLYVFGFPLPSRSSAQVELRQQPHHLDLVLSVTGQKSPDSRPLLLLADPRTGPGLDGPRLAGWADQLDASARRLEADGFAIIRNKVPYMAHPQWAPNPALRAYNNVFLENDIRYAQGKSRPLVWLPHFSDLEPDLEPFDRENRRVWEDLGFEPVPVYGWSALVRSGGSIRCASKVLRRGTRRMRD